MARKIALASNATVATRNVAHFAGFNINVVNPWAGSSSLWRPPSEADGLFN